MPHLTRRSAEYEAMRRQKRRIMLATGIFVQRGPTPRGKGLQGIMYQIKGARMTPAGEIEVLLESNGGRRLIWTTGRTTTTTTRTTETDPIA